MFIVCFLVGHKQPPFPFPLQEWRIIGHYAAMVDVYRCQRCGDEL